MFSTIKSFWKKVSFLGIDPSVENAVHHNKKQIFFNQVLFVGLFATIGQIIGAWSFIQEKSLFFLIIHAAIIVSLYLSKSRKFFEAKRFFLYMLYFMGTFMTFFLGGSSYYHLGALALFAFSLIVIDYKTEKILLYIGIPFIIMSLLIGELALFNTPVFDDSPALYVAKFINLFGLIFLNSIFSVFLIRINAKNERDLALALDVITESKTSLEKGKIVLEELVYERTAKINAQKNLLEEQNNQKEILLKEVHHRVKNNLQIILSLINLQMHKIENKAVEEALKDIQSKVISMSFAHNKLNKETGIEEIQLKEYVEEIIANIQKLNQSAGAEMSLNIPDTFTVKIDTAIPLGLIINEIITNFYKYVYLKDIENPTFSLNLTELEENFFHLIYVDNGPGFPENLTLESSQSLGLNLIDSLADQIEGRFDFFNDNGAVYSISLPK